MLVLTRKAGESIDIGHGLVVVRIKKIRGQKVSISIAAPKELTINRSEVELRCREENDAA